MAQPRANGIVLDSRDDEDEQMPDEINGGEETDSETEIEEQHAGEEPVNFAGVKQVQRFRNCFPEFFRRNGGEIYELDTDSATFAVVDDVAISYLDAVFRGSYDWFCSLRENEWLRRLSPEEFLRVVRYTTPFLIVFMVASNSSDGQYSFKGRKIHLMDYWLQCSQHEDFDVEYSQLARLYDLFVFITDFSALKGTVHPMVWYEYFKWIMSSIVGFPRETIHQQWHKKVHNFVGFSEFLKIAVQLENWMQARKNHRIFYDIFGAWSMRRTPGNSDIPEDYLTNPSMYENNARPTPQTCPLFQLLQIELRYVEPRDGFLHQPNEIVVANPWIHPSPF